MVCRYTILKSLGQGAYGKLYLVEDARDGTQKALKTAEDNLCTDNRISAAETQIHLHVHHPYLMGGMDVFRPSDVDACGRPMADVTQGLLLPLAEYDLNKIMNDDKNTPTYPQFNALRASWQLACALEGLYAAGYAHLDIKPANILQKGDTTLLSDFGLALWNTTSALNGLVITPSYRPPYVLDGQPTPMSSYMPADLYSLGLTFLDITSGVDRPTYGGNENRYVKDLANTVNAYVDTLITWVNNNRAYTGFLEKRQQRWRLPLPSIDAFVEYLQIVKAMVSPTPTALTATDVRLRLEALWPAHPPAPALHVDPTPPLAEQYRAAAERVVARMGFKHPRALPHTVTLFLAVMAALATPPKHYVSEGLYGHTSWILPYLFACINIVATFYNEPTVNRFNVSYDPSNAVFYDDTYTQWVMSQYTAVCAALKVIATSEVLRGQYNFVLPAPAPAPAPTPAPAPAPAPALKKMSGVDAMLPPADPKALMQAATDGDSKTVALLLKAGTDVHFNDDQALRFASAYGHLAVVKVLVTAGANVHAKDDEALRWASESGHLPVVQFLVASGANVHANNDQALRSASESGHLPVVEVLVASGADVHAVDDYALRRASKYGHLPVVKVLVQAGANVHAAGDYALRYASSNGHLSVVEFLVKAGANVHTAGDEALRWASSSGHTAVVEFLVKAAQAFPAAATPAPALKTAVAAPGAASSATAVKRAQPSGFAAYQAFKTARYKDLRSQYSVEEAKARLAAEWAATKTKK